MGRVELRLDNAQIATLAASVGILCLHGLEAHMPPHATLKRNIVNLEMAIGAVAKLCNGKLPEEVLDACTVGWIACMKTIEEELNGQPDSRTDDNKQPE